VRAACKAARISSSAYYDWAARTAVGPSDREWEEAPVVSEMLDVHTHDDACGSLRMAAGLRRCGYRVNRTHAKRVIVEKRIVARDGMSRRVCTTIPDVTAPALPDLVRRNFSVGWPGRGACGDATDVSTGEGWLYLVVTWKHATRSGGSQVMPARATTAMKCANRPLPTLGI